MLVRHIPHSSTYIPLEYRQQLLIDDLELDREILRLTDWYTDELFADSDSDEVVFPVSRIICDPERFLDDNDEPAAKVGMGVFYTLGTEGQLIRLPDELLREQIITEYYQSHHHSLTAKVSDYVERFGKAGVLDCHSFPSIPLPTDDHLDTGRPDFCLGFDEFHAPHDVIQEVESLLISQGFTVSINSPYRGCLIPSDFYGLDARVSGLMIEVNRSIYMDETTSRKNDRFVCVQKAIRECILEPFKKSLKSTRSA